SLNLPVQLLIRLLVIPHLTAPVEQPRYAVRSTQHDICVDHPKEYDDRIGCPAGGEPHRCSRHHSSIERGFCSTPARTGPHWAAGIFSYSGSVITARHPGPGTRFFSVTVPACAS